MKSVQFVGAVMLLVHKYARSIIQMVLSKLQNVNKLPRSNRQRLDFTLSMFY